MGMVTGYDLRVFGIAAWEISRQNTSVLFPNSPFSASYLWTWVGGSFYPKKERALVVIQTTRALSWSLIGDCHHHGLPH